jgi:hypothetical protein
MNNHSTKFNGWEVQSNTTMFFVGYEVAYIAKTFLLQLTTTCFGLIGHHQVVNTSCKESEDKKGVI